MKFFVEGASPAEEKRIRSWLAILADELGITGSGYAVHVMISNLSQSTAQMIPMPTPDKRLFIELNIKRPSKWLAGLSHEMVHVKQVIRGENILVDSNTGLAYWHGEPYNLFKFNKAAERSYEFYRSLPWEQEAHDRMWNLAEAVVRRMR